MRSAETVPRSWRTLESRVLRKAQARFGEGRLGKCRERQLASRLLYFVIFCETRDDAEIAQETIRAWLGERGLTLSEEKTRIVHLSEGFDFLGFNATGLRKRAEADGSC